MIYWTFFCLFFFLNNLQFFLPFQFFHLHFQIEHLLKQTNQNRYSIIRGPLTYHGIEFDIYGGVHYNGCAFEDGGYREEDADDERRRYREVCIESLGKEAREGEVGEEGEKEK